MALLPCSRCSARKIEGVLKMVNVGKQGVESRVRPPANGQTRCIDDMYSTKYTEEYNYT